ncbi:MAG TPA: topoisomerase DNA-binding C4 zinc finger domain-containing protein [Candidatus Woesebacteria bacterium]|nr:topoisomerase DNA-binding C4 zinc finger domain-containing protein [Candidatus Woesebacteria bacterium]
MKKTEKAQTETENTKCPKCGSALNAIETLPSGKRLQRCSQGSWNAETRKTEGCDYVKWFNPEPEQLDEKCPKCGEPLVMVTTRFGKKMKKCSAGGWDKETKTATGCDFVEWFNGTKEELDEACPQCGARLLFVTTATGKKMKKCSTAGWDREAKKATGCTYVEWINERKQSNGDENFPEYEI